ncbi:MAG: hypothetical protein LBC41_10115 [Clostridiales bacterium]|jgi:hypothetical protein|nr:hypothetical protein [Clostridiales bacterium]MDR2751005.1 hypothetical protein [Clostridiales bacterium]
MGIFKWINSFGLESSGKVKKNRSFRSTFTEKRLNSHLKAFEELKSGIPVDEVAIEHNDLTTETLLKLKEMRSREEVVNYVQSSLTDDQGFEFFAKLIDGQ